MKALAFVAFGANDDPLEIRYRDLHFWGFSVEDFQGW
jgi:hypothetical protein